MVKPDWDDERMGGTMIKALHMTNLDAVGNRCILGLTVGDCSVLVRSFWFLRWLPGFIMQTCRVGSVAGLAGLLSMAIFVYMTTFEATPAQALSLYEASSFR